MKELNEVIYDNKFKNEKLIKEIKNSSNKIEYLISENKILRDNCKKLENDNKYLINENNNLKYDLIEKNKQIKVLENMNNILNEKIEKIKTENDALTMKLFERSKKFLNDSTFKSGLETLMKNKNDKDNNYKDNNFNTINSRINLPNMPKNSFNKQIIVSKKKLTREQLNEIIQNIYKSKIKKIKIFP